MKIVSKYKDFYDFITQDYDADLIYVREPMLVYDSYDKLWTSKRQDAYISYTGGRVYYNLKSRIGEMYFSNKIFGIYPYVYSQPMLNIVYSMIGNTPDTITVILPKSIVDGFLSSNKAENEKAMTSLYEYAYKELDNKSYVPRDIKLILNHKDIKEALSMYVWKIDCPEIFYKLHAPVFVHYYESLFYGGVYQSNWDNIKVFGTKPSYKYSPVYVTNISFEKLNTNILKYWYNELFDLNTYINIENFLWSIRQEPVSNPDNNTKILAHGFDLKTSFRKM